MLPGPAKMLRIERVDTGHIDEETYDENNPFLSIDLFATEGSGHWRLWLMANGDFTLGTFIQLLDDGTINRITWHEDGTETVMEIRNEEEILYYEYEWMNR